MNEFNGKRVVVTGACGVFGRWIVTAFAQAGARVCLSDNRADALQADVKTLQGNDHLTHVTELTDAASVDALVDHVEAHWGSVDIVVNNAGIYPSGHLIDMPVEDWDRIWAVNLRAPFLVARGFARLMAAKGNGGSIINIGSGAARNMRETTVHYCASKTALERVTKGMAIEFAPFGIRVNVVEPGFAPGSEVSPLSEAHVTRVLGNIPLGRASGPKDTPGAILYLCSSEAEFITGTVLSVDGGNSIGLAATYSNDILERIDRWQKD
jgi:3-oxoacyl-[acyl-carrier protein] reductase